MQNRPMDIKSIISDVLKNHTLVEHPSGRTKCSCGVTSIKGHHNNHIAVAIAVATEPYYVVRPQCHYCDKVATSRDHIVPRFAGGMDVGLNIVPSCVKHNSDKGATLTSCRCVICLNAISWHVEHVLIPQPRDLKESLYRARFRRHIKPLLEGEDFDLTGGYREVEVSGDDAGRLYPRGGRSSSRHLLPLGAQAQEPGAGVRHREPAEGVS